jgi:ERCC4-type nuclease
VLGYILERKSQDDLRSSKKDGRLSHQKYRLTSSRVANKLYLVEGDVKQLGAAYAGGCPCLDILADKCSSSIG